MRSKFIKTGSNTVTHTGICPFSKVEFVRRYWVRPQGGYVYIDTSHDGRLPGTLGRQPHTDGVTWECAPEYLLVLIKEEWRREMRQAKHKR
jgi:hypothetical protein